LVIIAASYMSDETKLVSFRQRELILEAVFLAYEVAKAKYKASVWFPERRLE
jgi:hypothetical protein